MMSSTKCNLSNVLFNNVAMMMVNEQVLQQVGYGKKARRPVTLSIFPTTSANSSDITDADFDVPQLRRTSFRSSWRRSISGVFRHSKSAEQGNDSDTSSSPTSLRKFRARSASDFLLGTFRQGGGTPTVLVDSVPSGLPEGHGAELEDLRQHIDPALLHGSSSNFGGAGVRSAPSTPHSLLLGTPTTGNLSDGGHSSGGGGSGSGGGNGTNNGGASGAGSLGANAGGNSPPGFVSLSRSPSHHLFTKHDKNSIKQLSSSTPMMTAQAQSPEPPSPKGSNAAKTYTSSKARQKKFHRHFGDCKDEIVLNYYSCALQADILLQGHLYITKNYFAFYSNVFGYVTKILIPILSVAKITKEKTARIIPNAVGIATQDSKHVFGSLMSRESTYRFMNEVWETAIKQAPELPPHSPTEESESSDTPEECGKESDITDNAHGFATCTNPKVTEAFIPADVIDGGASIGGGSQPNSLTVPGVSNGNKESKSASFTDNYKKLVTVPKQSIFLYATTFLLVLLFLSAAVLLYRIGRVQRRYTIALQDNHVLPETEAIYGDLYQWQSHLHSKSAGAVHNYLDSNLDQISKVRQSLEALSALLVPNDDHRTGQTATPANVKADGSTGGLNSAPAGTSGSSDGTNGKAPDLTSVHS